MRSDPGCDYPEVYFDQTCAAQRADSFLRHDDSRLQNLYVRLLVQSAKWRRCTSPSRVSPLVIIRFLERPSQTWRNRIKTEEGSHLGIIKGGGGRDQRFDIFSGFTRWLRTAAARIKV